MTNINVVSNFVRIWNKENKIEIGPNEESEESEVPKNKMTISRWLKIMQRVLLLPAKFVESVDANTKLELKVTKTRTFVVFCADMMSMLMSFAFMILFHYLNKKEDSSTMTDVFSKDFVVGMFNGITTDAIAQVAIWSFSSFIWHPIMITGLRNISLLKKMQITCGIVRN